MPYLNWKEAPITQNIGEHESRELKMELGLPAAQLASLATALADLLPVAGQEVRIAPELRVDLPRGWIVFWKLREGESRLLVAHPQAEEWVATIAMNTEDARVWSEHLKTAHAPATAIVGEFLATQGAAGVASVSNLELELKLL